MDLENHMVIGDYYREDGPSLPENPIEVYNGLPRKERHEELLNCAGDSAGNGMHFIAAICEANGIAEVFMQIDALKAHIGESEWAQQRWMQVQP